MFPGCRGQRAGAQFGRFNVNKQGKLPPNQFDALILDDVGIIFGTELRYDWDTNAWVGDRQRSFHTVVKRSGDRFTELAKNACRVLFTRGMKGCYVYFVDEGTRRFFQSRLE